MPPFLRPSLPALTFPRSALTEQGAETIAYIKRQAKQTQAQKRKKGAKKGVKQESNESKRRRQKRKETAGGDRRRQQANKGKAKPKGNEKAKGKESTSKRACKRACYFNTSKADHTPIHTIF